VASQGDVQLHPSVLENLSPTAVGAQKPGALYACPALIFYFIIGG
jgi:hypothetical protein